MSFPRAARARARPEAPRSAQEKNEGLRSAAAAASKGGTANEARLQDRESYIASLQARRQRRSVFRPGLQL
jgi:hypothetical protein